MVPLCYIKPPYHIWCVFLLTHTNQAQLSGRSNPQCNWGSSNQASVTNIVHPESASIITCILVNSLVISTKTIWILNVEPECSNTY